MEVMLKPELEKFIADKIKAGQFTTVSDAVNQAVDNMRASEECTPEHAAYLKQEVLRGIKQLDRGEFVEFSAETVIAEKRRGLQANHGNQRMKDAG